MPIPAPRVFTIPPSAPFLPTLIKALVAGKLVPGFPASGDPLALAQATLYLPTQRACRLARDMFLETLGQKAAVLPRILAIGDLDEDDLAFADAATGPIAAEALALPQTLKPLERRMLLTQLILKWVEGIRPDRGAPLVAATPAAALALADDLARLIDDMVTRQVDWKRLDDLVPDRFDKYWQLTLEFLKIARDLWPQILSDLGAIEPAERRDRLIEAEAARLKAIKDGPVIAAGSTGSMPSTAMLLETIAKLPHGAVVLPGLDRDLDDSAWELITGKRQDGGGHDRDIGPAAGHPQFAMQALLRRIGIDRHEVASLAAPALPHREKLISQALCPAAACECWQARLADHTIAAALDGVAVVEAANAEDEALAIAVALREAVAEGKTAALVTPDRALARRVVAALGRWKVAVEDSAGVSLLDTPAGIFARLAAESALGGLAPVTLLALLKHPLMRLRASEAEHRHAVGALERALLRGPRPKAGTSGLRHALATFRATQDQLHRGDPRRFIASSELDAAEGLIDRLAKALAPLEEIGKAPRPFGEIATRHREVVAALGGEGVFQGDAGIALNRAFEGLAETAGGLLVAPSDYSELFETAVGDVIRRHAAPTVRVRIFGLLEARLQDVDRMVLGGLVEGTWPPEARTDAWLSRPMRHELGLDLPERRIGLTAHDFAQSLGAREVILARAAKVGGAPTLWSRFVQRLRAVAGDQRWNEAVARGEKYLAWARALDAPVQPPKPAPRPEPKPPREARPSGLSVTEIEHWLRDPYTIYAKHILRIRPLDAVDEEPGARDRGNVIHGAIGKFTERFAVALPADPLAELIAIGKAEFAPLADYPEARAFWWPRFERIAAWFVHWDHQRRAALILIHAETKGEMPIQLGERVFTLRGIADRIEKLNNGRYAILDYKTGQAPTAPQVRSGLSPQLTLEAAMIRRGGFSGIPAQSSVNALAYVLVKGGEPAANEKLIAWKDTTPDSQADIALQRLTEVALAFEDETTPYRSLVHPMWRTSYGDYDHLARVKEWSLNGGEDETDFGAPPS